MSGKNTSGEAGGSPRKSELSSELPRWDECQDNEGIAQDGNQSQSGGEESFECDPYEDPRSRMGQNAINQLGGTGEKS